MLSRSACALIGVLSLAVAVPLSAQTVTGTVEGSITDTSGGRLPGVHLELRSLETGQVRASVSNEQGLFQIPFVPLGRYRLAAELSGFGARTREIEVRLNQTTSVDLVMSPAIEEQVVVLADRPQVNVSSGELKSALTADQIMDRPTVMNLNNVNQFLSLAETFAGFQENPTSGQNNPTASSGSSINFNGTGTRGATFQINGVNNDDYSENQNRQGVPLATIKEFQVISNTYSAEFGRGYGAVVLVQTKQGTNKVDGEAYFSRQDSDWNARSFFSPTKPVNARNQWGGVIGGPVVRDRLFAFASFEHARQQGEQTIRRDVFTAADLARPRLTRGNDTPANRTFVDSILARFGELAPNDPANPGRTWVGLQELDRPVKDYSFRLDYTAGPRDHLTARWHYSRQLFTAQDVIPGEVAQQNHRQQNFGVTWTRTYSSRSAGEFRYGLGVRDTNVDVKDGNDTPVIRFAGTTFASVIGNAGNFPIHRDQLDHQLVYNFTALVGSRHSLKAGMDARFSNLDDIAQNFNRGFWNFNAACGGTTYPSAYAAFLDGCIATYQEAFGPDSSENSIREYNFYVEDSFRASPSLTLNLGLRYEIAQAPKESQGRIDYGYGADADNLEPRVSFAWSPEGTSGLLGRLFGGAGNGSLRGGYGLYHGRLFQSIFSQGGASVRTNPPNAALLTFTNQLNVSDPTNGFVFQPGNPTARVNLALVDPDLHLPYTHQWNLTYERKVPWNSAIRLSYTGSRGRDFIRYELANLPVAPGTPGSTYVLAADFLCAGTGGAGLPTNATCPAAVPIAANEISARVPRTNERRPDARYGTNTVVSNAAQTWYDGFQVEWVKRFSNGLDFQMNYTRSVAEDTTSEATALGVGDSNQLGPDRRLTRAYSRFHTPHRFAFNGTYRLPFFAGRKDVVGQVLGGWRLSAVVKVASGTPFTVVDTGAIDTNFDGFAEQRPVLLDPSLVGVGIDDPATSQQLLARASFRRATPADYGNLSPRNAFFTDGVRNVDLALAKTFRTMDDHQLILRVEAFNAFNRVQFGFPTNDFASANFGRITGGAASYTPRIIQLALRYVF